MDKRHPIDLALSGTADAAGTRTLETQIFAGGGLLCLQRVAVRCASDATLVAHVSFDRAGSKLYLETLTTTVAGQIASLQGPVFAPSDYGVTIEFSSVGAGEQVYAWIYGYWTPPAE